MTILHLTLGIIAILWVIFTVCCIKDGFDYYGNIDSDLKSVNFAVNAILILAVLIWIIGEINWNYKII